MGFTPNSQWTGASYWNSNHPFLRGSVFGTYKNTASTSRKLDAITLYLGTGTGYFNGSVQGNGTGNPITVTVRVNSNSSNISASQTVTNKIASNGSYANTKNCAAYKFSFANAPIVNAGASVNLYISVPNVSGNILIENKSGTSHDSNPNVTVKFNLQGGTRTGGGQLEQTVAYGGSATAPTCTRTGYTFAGWDSSLSNITSNKTINAKWTINKYTVKFDLKGGTRTGGGALTQTVEYNKGAIAPTCTRTGYTFSKWDKSFSNVTASITVNAVWTQNTYKVTFDLAGGTRTGGGQLEQTVVHGGSATPPTCTKTGSTFAGWSGSYTNVTSTRTITARWNIDTYTITFNANGGVGAPSAGIKEYGKAYTIPTTKPTASYTITFNPNGGTVIPTIQQVNRPFKCWNTMKDGNGKDYFVGDQYTDNGPITLYAIYNNGNVSSLPVPTGSRRQYEMWTTRLNDRTTQFKVNTVVPGNITVYAYWKWEILFHADNDELLLQDPGDNVIPAEDIFPNIDVDTMADPVHSLSVYKSTNVDWKIPYVTARKIQEDEYDDNYMQFAGWAKTSGANTAAYTQNGTITGITNYMDLYPVFKVPTYTVTFEDGFGKVIKTQKVERGKDATPPDADYVQKNFGKPGYTFQGWFGDYTGVIGDTTITALWGFTPIWIMHNKKWVKYRAREEE